jgi:hypothetical protein
MRRNENRNPPTRDEAWLQRQIAKIFGTGGKFVPLGATYVDERAPNINLRFYRGLARRREQAMSENNARRQRSHDSEGNFSDYSLPSRNSAPAGVVRVQVDVLVGGNRERSNGGKILHFFCFYLIICNCTQ